MDQAAVRNALARKAAIYETAYQDGDLDRMVTSFYYRDGVMVGPDGKVTRGHAALKALFAAYQPAVSAVRLDPRELQFLSETSVVEIANSTLVAHDGTETACHYTACWRLEGDDWLCTLDMFGLGYLDDIEAGLKQ